jgi:hypothetical protein
MRVNDMQIWRQRTKRTKIQDQPSKPRVPPIKLIPYAKRPENAPAIEAAPKKMPMRYCNLYRGYQKVRLVAIWLTLDLGKDKGNTLVYNTRE